MELVNKAIFNHKTRQLISEGKNPFGWRLIAPNVVQIYGFGKRLPDELDVWFRAHSYAAGDPVVTLAATAGATCKLPGGTLTLEDIRAGSWSFSNNQLQKRSGAEHGNVSTATSFEGEWLGVDYQIAAVSARGEKIHTELPHFLAFNAGDKFGRPIEFDMPLDEIDHFELRPFGGRERFFFEAVTLPKASSKPFSKPPPATVNVAGKETEVALPQFDPLDVRIGVHRGQWAAGSMASHRRAVVMRAETVTDADKMFTFTYQVIGVGRLPLRFSFIDSATKKAISDAVLKRRGSGAGWAAASAAGYIEYHTPLDRIEAVNVTLGP